MMRGRFVMIAAAVSVLAGCERTAAPVDAPDAASPGASAAAFSHTISGDQSGYYLPVTDARAGDWRLDRIYMGQASDFAAWEAGPRNEPFGPLMLEFSDTSSPTQTNEMGGEAHTVTARVLPTRYSVTDDRVRFEGRSPELGAVTFEGRLDQEALATGKRNLGASEAPVLTGRLTFGRQTFNDQQFRWWMGD